MSALFLAVDGGQSGTVAVLATADGLILGTGRGGPIRHHEEPDAGRFVRDALDAAVGEAMLGAGPDDTIAVCTLALTGSTALADAAIREKVRAGRYHSLTSDTFAALASGTHGRGGVAVIAGTGTVALAQGRDGLTILGGWGWLLGDEGGGFWIAMEALRAAARGVDGTGPVTRLATELPSVLGQSDMRGVYNLVTGSRLDRTAIAALTTDVVRLADEGDLVAASVLDSAAARLAALVVATIAAAPYLRDDEKVVVACGGVLGARGRVLDGLTVLLAERVPDFRLVVPVVPPVIGAYYLGLAQGGIEVDDDIADRIAGQLRPLTVLTAKTALVPAGPGNEGDQL